MAEPGDVINGRYTLRARIESGATADVYVGDDLRLGRQVAVKVLSPVQARAERGIERFRAEAQAAAALSHPNIVAVYDWGTTDDTAFLVMQYVAGQDVRSLLRERGALSERTALGVAADIAAALAVAHSHGIVHRDVKPRNVLIDRQGSALLADFGIAAPTNGSAGKDAVYGTALYVSPEQAQGLLVDGRGDLYSLGALLYELLCGSPPFVGETAGEVARQHVSAPVMAPRARRPEISAATEQIVLRALEKDRERRFAGAEEMRQALLAAAAGVEATAPLAAETRGEASAPRSALEPPPARVGPRLTRFAAPRGVLLAVPLVALALAALVALPGLANGRQTSVPDLAGHSLQDAQVAIAAAGLQLTKEEQATLDTPAGVVVTQDPLPGSRPTAGSTVHAIVSSGISVPDVSGQQCAEARVALATQGWTVRPVRWRVANASDFGKIVSQDPAAGSVIKDKGEISVQVAGPVRPC